MTELDETLFAQQQVVVFTMVGITKYTTLHPDEKSAGAAFAA